jgi:glycosyltransferase involved in cell wall biosynthesis
VQPLVSVIMPTYNRANIISKSILSVIQQTYNNWELIVVDDYSKDNTKEMIDNISKNDSRVKYLLNSGKKGVSSAKNVAILVSHGDYIAFLDSDDEWTDNHLLDSIDVLVKENISVCFSLWKEMNDKGDCVKVFGSEADRMNLYKAAKELNAPANDKYIVFPAPGFFEYTVIKYFFCYNINTMVVKREVIENVGMFCEKLGATEDMDFIFRIFHKNSFGFILDYHYIYKQGADNIHHFIDRRNLNLDKLIYDKELLHKLTRNDLFYFTSIKMRKKLIENSDVIQEKKSCIREYNNRVKIKYFSTGYLNRKVNKPMAVYLLFKSLTYSYDSKIIKLLFGIMFPFLVKEPKVDLDELWI